MRLETCTSLGVGFPYLLELVFNFDVGNFWAGWWGGGSRDLEGIENSVQVHVSC
jgi:hypothetical protein